MDYDRNTFSKSIESIATLYDVRYTYNKNKYLIHSDEGLKEKFKARITSLIRYKDDVTGHETQTTYCPLMIAAVEEIIDSLDEDKPEPPKPPVKKKEIKEVIPVDKKDMPMFTFKSVSLDHTFQSSLDSGNILEAVSLEVIKKALESFDFNLTVTAKNLGINPRTLRTKIRAIRKREKLSCVS